MLRAPTTGRLLVLALREVEDLLQVGRVLVVAIVERRAGTIVGGSQSRVRRPERLPRRERKVRVEVHAAGGRRRRLVAARRCLAETAWPLCAKECQIRRAKQKRGRRTHISPDILAASPRLVVVPQLARDAHDVHLERRELRAETVVRRSDGGTCGSGVAGGVDGGERVLAARVGLRDAEVRISHKEQPQREQCRRSVDAPAAQHR